MTQIKRLLNRGFEPGDLGFTRPNVTGRHYDHIGQWPLPDFFFFFFFRKEVNRSGTLLLTTGSDTIEWSLPDLHLGFSFVYSLVRGLQAVVNAARAKQQKLQVWPFQGFEPVTS